MPEHAAQEEKTFLFAAQGRVFHVGEGAAVIPGSEQRSFSVPATVRAGLERRREMDRIITSVLFLWTRSPPARKKKKKKGRSDTDSSLGGEYFIRQITSSAKLLWEQTRWSLVRH